MTRLERLLPAASLALLCLGAHAARAQETEPFRARNLNPPVAIFGLPAWTGVPDAAEFGVITELANHYRLSRRGTDQLILDGETLRMTLFYERPLAERWSVGVELPVFRQSGGVLDDVIDGWHSAFGLPDGGRNNRPEDRIEFDLMDAGGTFFRLDGSDEGIGDMQLSIARRFGTDQGYVLRASVKLATGEETILAGSGSTDWSLTLLRQRPVSLERRSAGYFWGAGIMKLGAPDLIRFPVEDRVAVGVLGGSLALGPRVGFKAQLDVYSPLYDTPLEELGQTAVQATLGGWWRLSGAGRLDVAVIEDLHVSTAPDVALHVALRWLW